MKRATTIILALTAVAVVGLAVAARQNIKAVIPAAQVGFGAKPISVTSSRGASVTVTKSTNTGDSSFPAKLTSGQQGSVTLSSSTSSGLVTYTVGSASCSYSVGPGALPDHFGVSSVDSQGMSCNVASDGSSFVIQVNSAG